ETPLVEGQNSAAVDLFDLRHAREVLTAFGRAFGALPEGPADLSAEQARFVEQAVSGLAVDGKVISVRLALFAATVPRLGERPAGGGVGGSPDAPGRGRAGGGCAGSPGGEGGPLGGGPRGQGGGAGGAGCAGDGPLGGTSPAGTAPPAAAAGRDPAGGRSRG